MSFAEVHAAHPWDEVLASVQRKTDADVLRALARAEADSADLEDFKALISPAAAPHLERMARLSHERTLRRYGRTMQLFAPAYLSNECQNVCTYCGFSAGNKVPRRTLNPGEILREAGALKKLGFDHLLILTGESNKVEVPYFVQALDLLRPHFSSLSMEVQPMETAEYAELRKHGLNAVLVYQETYHRETYNVHHPKGRKSDFAYRLDAPDRVGAAGVHKIGLGALFGLEGLARGMFLHGPPPPLARTQALAEPLQRLLPAHPSPRGRTAAEGGDDRPRLVQAICAFRLLSSEVELTLSTRESRKFRDHACRVGVTAMSAGSHTNPGGYAEGREASLEQFAIEDDRSPDEVAAMLRAHGYEPVWKDWDPSYDRPVALA
jgi:2-iminoacetate synthase